MEHHNSHLKIKYSACYLNSKRVDSSVYVIRMDVNEERNSKYRYIAHFHI